MTSCGAPARTCAACSRTCRASLGTTSGRALAVAMAWLIAVLTCDISLWSDGVWMADST
jgi:hypothetical protein